MVAYAMFWSFFVHIPDTCQVQRNRDYTAAARTCYTAPYALFNGALRYFAATSQ